MSLRPEDLRREAGKSRSRSRGDRGRSPGGVRFEEADDNDSHAKPSKTRKSARFANEAEDRDEAVGVFMPDMPDMPAMPAMPGASEELRGTHREATIRKPSRKKHQASSDEESASDSASDHHNEGDVHSPTAAKHSRRKAGSRLSDDLAYGDNSHHKATSVPYPEEDHFGLQYPHDDSPTSLRARMPSVTNWTGYIDPEPYKYADTEKVQYTAKPNDILPYRHTAEPLQPKQPLRTVSFPQDYRMNPRDEKRKVDKAREEKKHARTDRLSVDMSNHEKRGPSPSGRLGHSSNRLSVDTGLKVDHVDKVGKPPASPLLDAYHGTYQSISPMPSPIMAAQDDEVANGDSDSISEADLDEEDLKKTSDAKKKLRARAEKKHVKLYDAEGDADKIGAALNHREARPGPLIEVLPELTHDQLLALRGEYKKRVKIQGRGVNLAKQVKATTNGNFGKVCYATALGRWESESYWANFWYQAHSANRELLIEALMGRSNADIREIKDGFRDKRYRDDLVLCMQKELKPNKFQTAVLLALEGARQEETDVWPSEYRNKDVETLYRALKSRDGGETAILEIVVMRSNNHLRDVLKTFEKVHKENLAKAALKKSTNLVGEVIAHILNGVINRPARDSLLLRHAINDVTSKEGDIRYELLMSRLIRLHWDRAHLAKVKDEYEHKYRESLERSVKKATKGDFGAFCVRLCDTQ